VDTSLPSWNISTINPTCNRLHSLQDAIERALKQTYPVLEVIVSIDSSPDCVKIIKNIWEGKDDRVRVFKVPPCPQNPCGTGRSRNHAIEKASPYATHFALLDDDDVWYPQKTEIQVKTMQMCRGMAVVTDPNTHHMILSEAHFTWQTGVLTKGTFRKSSIFLSMPNCHFMLHEQN
jgi:glycosyltransferase involved in cell wall biosynthesis